MSQHLIIPTRSLGFGYDLELHDWNQRLQAYRIFEGQPKELLEGGLGLGLNLIRQFTSNIEWYKSIPKEFLAKSAPFPEHQYQMLWLAANVKPAAQILLTRPLLLVLICEHYSVDNETAKIVAQLGQRDILKRLGYHGSKGALKFIDKLVLKFDRDIELQHVKKQLDKRFCRYQVFKHYSMVNFNALSIDNRYPFLTGTRFGQVIASDQNIKRVSLVAYLLDALMLGVQLGINDPVQRIGILQSIDELEQLHQRWVDRRNNLRRQQLRPKDADKPYPIIIVGNEQIIAINNYDALFDEGAKMKHCIAIYHQQIASGEYCAFSMLKPERMTIGVKIIKKETTLIQLDQISGVCNSLPSNEAREHAYRWLEITKKSLIDIVTN
ncbi:PcfJ domain-containing protein [Shewanella sp. 10N.286.51.B2]|uniref:PcfJ domain-containing protein n=1 Tax=Shewanella sp. 10N.286.51.B2 TaxID=3229707 RepID=UPI00354CC06F